MCFSAPLACWSLAPFSEGWSIALVYLTPTKEVRQEHKVNGRVLV